MAFETGDMSNVWVPGEYPGTRTRRVPGFGHPQNPRVSSQTRTRHGFSASGLGTRVLIIRGTSGTLEKKKRKETKRKHDGGEKKKKEKRRQEKI